MITGSTTEVIDILDETKTCSNFEDFPKDGLFSQTFMNKGKENHILYSKRAHSKSLINSKSADMPLL